MNASRADVDPTADRRQARHSGALGQGGPTWGRRYAVRGLLVQRGPEPERPDAAAGDIIGSVPIDGGATSTIASGPNGAPNVALDANFVYWDEAGTTLYRAALDGGTPVSLGAGCGGPVAVDAAGVYCAGGGVLTRTPLGGGDATTVVSYAQLTPSQLKAAK